MNIRKINPNDAEIFSDFLFKLDGETKFMLFEKDERKFDVDEFKNMLYDIKDFMDLILVVEEKNKIVGFLKAERGNTNRIKHRAYIVLGILSDYCGLKLGDRLLTELEKWAFKYGIKRLELTVMCSNERAVKLYTKKGYEIEGIRKKSILLDGETIDEYYMAKIL